MTRPLPVLLHILKEEVRVEARRLVRKGVQTFVRKYREVKEEKRA